MKYADLPPKLRARVDAQVGKPARPRTGKGGGIVRGGRWQCATEGCGERFTAWAAVDRHDPTHRRIECQL